MTKAARWAWTVALVAVTGVVLVLSFVLSLALEGDGGLERHFVWLFWLNVAVAVLLAMIIGFVAVRLIVRVRLRKFGSRLLMKLAGIFAMVGLLPGLLIYTVSYQFVSRSIEVWFDARMAGALDAGLALGRGTLDAMQRDLTSKSRVAVERLSEGRLSRTPIALERVREQLGASEVSLVGASGQVLVSSGGGPAAVRAMMAERPPASLLAAARQAGVASRIEGLDEESVLGGRGARLLALVRLPRQDLSLSGAEEQYLHVVLPVAQDLALNALEVQAAYGEYQRAHWRATTFAACTSARSPCPSSSRCSAPCCWRSCSARRSRARCCCWPTACARWRPATSPTSRCSPRPTNSAG
jgi:nitrogen fixation/metabolism regulation signal transduction histidine kinase